MKKVSYKKKIKDMAASSLLIVVSTAIGGMSDAFDKDK